MAEKKKERELAAFEDALVERAIVVMFSKEARSTLTPQAQEKLKANIAPAVIKCWQKRRAIDAREILELVDIKIRGELERRAFGK